MASTTSPSAVVGFLGWICRYESVQIRMCNLRWAGHLIRLKKQDPKSRIRVTSLKGVDIRADQD